MAELKNLPTDEEIKHTGHGNVVQFMNDPKARAVMNDSEANDGHRIFKVVYRFCNQERGTFADFDLCYS